MSRQYGYFYDENGKFTDYRLLEEKPIYEKQTFYREEQKEIVTEEKLCSLHQSIEDGTYKPDQESVEEPISKYECPNCVMHNVEYVPVQVPYVEDVIVGYEPDIPENCTLEVCPWLAYEPRFDKETGKWVKTVEPKVEEPQPQEPSELEKLKRQLELTQQALDDVLLGGM